MTKRVKELFSKRGRKESGHGLLSIFLTAGYPEEESALQICRTLETSGVDFIELGIPFSDPLADGPVIQASSAKALKNGITVSKVIEQLKIIRSECTIPVFLMGYLNPIFQYDVERFLDEIAVAGGDGVILPDLPVRDYEEKYQDMFEERELSNIFLVTPLTPEQRVRKLDALTNAFLYAVSSPSITGSKLDSGEGTVEYLKRLLSYQLNNPHIVGFGISDRESFERVTKYSSGAIIGSAFVRLLEEHGVDIEKIEKFVKSIRG